MMNSLCAMCVKTSRTTFRSVIARERYAHAVSRNSKALQTRISQFLGSVQIVKFPHQLINHYN